MVLAAVMLISTTIRQTAFSRRRETGIMRLVGASNFTIRFPFVMETVIASVLGATLAMGMLWATVRYGVVGFLSETLTDTAFIGVADVLYVAPFIIVGVVVLSSVDLVGDPPALPPRLTTTPLRHPCRSAVRPGQTLHNRRVLWYQ